MQRRILGKGPPIFLFIPDFHSDIFMGFSWRRLQRGVMQDNIQATALFRKAAAQGDLMAQDNLGVMNRD
ncbi:MAG: hypothetical protein ACYTFK_14175, partial [Planctomycetota bacterium]